MFLKSSSRKALLEQLQLQLADQRALTEAIQKHIAVIEFNPDKTIRFANTGFLEMVGYRLEDLERQPHAIFCDPGVADSREYRAFWEQLHQGRSQAGTFMRRRQDGSALWIEATYFPIMQEGRLQKVVKFAADVTESKLRQDSQRALYEAFNRSQAIIEFSPAGEVLGANDNFLRVVGYRLEEIVGKHHRLFCSDAFYEDNPHFWRDLAAGEFKSGQFDRISRSGARVWLEATYNPVFDDSGNVIKVVKLASDITARVERADAIQQAAEVAHSTAVETAQISEQGTGVLTRTVEISSQIDDEVHRTAELIGKLNTQSEAISQIVTTIGSIADQTNLLALNAAIEAARAGDHGRGFAVVADEVRQLAARTGKSTVEIEGMVRQNSELAREVKSSMDRVRAQAAESNQLINEAAAVIDEIRQGADNVSQTVVELT